MNSYYNYGIFSDPKYHYPPIVMDPPSYPRSEGRRVKIWQHFRKLPWFLLAIQAVLFIAGLLLLFGYFILRTQSAAECGEKSPNNTENAKKIDQFRKMKVIETISPKGATKTTTEPTSFDFEKYSGVANAAVLVNIPVCGVIGRSILLHGGSAVDAAISASLCLSLFHPHKGGIGGGLQATVHVNQSCTVMNARETAPVAANKDVFSKNPKDMKLGSKSSSIPGYIHGLWRLFERFSNGNQSWKDLVQPVLDLSRKGVPVDKDLANALVKYKTIILKDIASRKLFLDSKNGGLLKEGEMLINTEIYATLLEISEMEDNYDFYNGHLAQRIIKDNNMKDGLFSSADFEDYESEYAPGMLSSVGNFSLCGPPPPSTYSFVQLAAKTSYVSSTSSTSLNDTIRLLHLDSKAIGDPVFTKSHGKSVKNLKDDEIQIILERLKKGERAPTLENSDETASSVLVVDESGMAVALSASIGTPFGSGVLSSLGFFLNNAISLFDEPSKDFANSIQPGKSARTDIATVIATKDNEASFLLTGCSFSQLSTSLHALLTNKSSEARVPFIQIQDEGFSTRSSEAHLLQGY